MSLYKHFYAIGALAVILSAASYGSSRVKHAPPPSNAQNVTVVNTSAQPVPTTLQGTPSVSISGTPTVAISGSPTVQLSGSPAVSISNDSNSPVPVTVVNASGHIPIDASVSLTFPDGQIGGGQSLYTVPAGKRLVIQTSFMRAKLGTGQAIADATLDRTVVNPTSFPITMQHQATDYSGFERYTGSVSGPFYFESGAIVSGSFLRNGGTGPADMSWVLTGYLENN